MPSIKVIEEEPYICFVKNVSSFLFQLIEQVT